MNKSIVIALTVVILLGTGYAVYSSSQKKEASISASEKQADEGAIMQEKVASATTSDTMMKKDGAMMAKGSYEAFDASKLARARDGHVVLFFRAGWCPTCRALDADIKAHLSDIPTGLTILDLNYDAEKALEQKYGVTHQHTLVEVAADGTLIKKWDGSPTLADIVMRVK